MDPGRGESSQGPNHPEVRGRGQPLFLQRKVGLRECRIFQVSLKVCQQFTYSVIGVCLTRQFHEASVIAANHQVVQISQESIECDAMMF